MWSWEQRSVYRGPQENWWSWKAYSLSCHLWKPALQERDTSHTHITLLTSCQLFPVAIKSHLSVNKVFLNILIGLLLQELSTILQAVSTILKGQTYRRHILLHKSEQRMQQKEAEPRPNFQKDFRDKERLLVLSKHLWFPTVKFVSTLYNLRCLSICLISCPSCRKYVHVNFPNTA